MRTILSSTAGMESSSQQQLASGVSSMVRIIGDHGAAVGEIMAEMNLGGGTQLGTTAPTAPATTATVPQQRATHQQVGVRV